MSLPIPVPGFWFYTSLFKLFSFCLTFSTFPLSVPAPSLPFSTPCNQLPPLSFPVVCTFSLSVTTHCHFSPILPCQFFPFSLPIHAPSLPVPHLFSTLPLSVPSFPLTPPRRQHYMAKWLECWLAGNFESTVSILYCLYSGSCKIFGMPYSVTK